MTTAKNKKPAARKRGATAAQSTAADQGRIRRFAASAVAAALASFQIVSCSINPNWSVDKLVTSALGSLHIPALDALRKQDWGLPAPATPAAPGSAAQAGSSKEGSQATRFAGCSQFFPGGQAPALQKSPAQRELCFSGFAVLHDGQTKTPIFVAERLNRTLLQQAQGMQRTDKFYADARLPRAERAELDDYKHSGFSRGHMAPAGDMATPEAMAQSFSLANMVPQNQIHNAGAWSKVEQDTRKYALRAKGDVYVFTGPIFDSRAPTIGTGKVHVPAYLFKLVYDASTGQSWVHWQANSPDTRMDAPISYEEFTRRTGMPLLSNIRRAGA